MLSCFKGKFKVTSPRGYRNIFGSREYHDGLDIVALDDDTVYTFCDGVCDVLSEPNGFGNYVRVRTRNGIWYYYAHLSSIYVKQGQTVKSGEPIGVMGSSGRCTGAHTHICCRVGGTKTSLDISYFTGIPNSVGVYTGYPTFTFDEAISLIQIVCGLEDKTIDFIKTYKWCEDLAIKIANKIYF
ncbi:MAG: M23 family metallopeptidase [Lachnospiraceae bacterium]|nr:M23 family metallopeptidase [Lachnospiraceae bacterium]